MFLQKLQVKYLYTLYHRADTTQVNKFTMGCMNGLHTPGARSIPLYAAAQ
jgi:hypothetical protein